MTPQERELIVDLFDRLAALERKPRDPEAEARHPRRPARAPNAVYALVQTVLVQDEALKAANARIQRIRAAAVPRRRSRSRGFLDNMRDTIFGRDEPRGSVPRVQPGAPQGRADPWGRDRDGPPQNYQQQPYQQQPYQQQPYAEPPRPGGSFLGTAAAAAAGVIGGALLMNGIRSAFAGHQAGPFSGAFDQLSGRSPGAGSDLAREAGLGDVGGRFDQRQQDATQDAQQDTQDDQDQSQDDEQDAGDDRDTDTDTA